MPRLPRLPRRRLIHKGAPIPHTGCTTLLLQVGARLSCPIRCFALPLSLFGLPPCHRRRRLFLLLQLALQLIGKVCLACTASASCSKQCTAVACAPSSSSGIARGCLDQDCLRRSANGCRADHPPMALAAPRLHLLLLLMLLRHLVLLCLLCKLELQEHLG